MPNKDIIRYFDNTRVSTAKNCLRQYYLRHKRDWVRDGKAIALSFGSCWHEAMDVVYGLMWTDKTDKEIHTLAVLRFNQKWVEEGYPTWEDMSPEEEDHYAPRTPGIAAEMLYHYIDQKRPRLINHYTLISIEPPFAVPIFPNNPNIFYIGRYDKVIRENSSGKIILVEHKTTTSYKKNGPFRADWMESWSPNSQVDGYLYSANLIYENQVKELWLDAALVHKTVHDGFKFIPINRSFEMMNSWLYETRFWINLIIAQEEELDKLRRISDELKPNYMPVFPKNTGSCSHWAGCSLRDVCKMIPNPEGEEEPPLGYKEEHWSPFDVLELEKIGMKPEGQTGE